MTIENISWSVSMKECCRPRQGRTRDLLVSSRTHIQLSHRGREYPDSCFFVFLFNPCPAEPGYTLFCKQCRSRSVGFWRSQLIWICTVCHSECEFISTICIKEFDWLKIWKGRGILIYSAGQGLMPFQLLWVIMQYLPEKGRKWKESLV